MEKPVKSDILVEGIDAPVGTQLHLLGRAEPLSWRMSDAELLVTLPQLTMDAPVYTLCLG
ncbi:hypothetical protein GC175_21615 [bacterium]|nr:hypothetical protein [bacterium]